MTLLDFFRTCPGMEQILVVEEYSGQLVVYADAIAARDIPYDLKCNYFEAIIERFLPEHFGAYESTEYLSDEAIKILTSIQVNIADEDLYEFDSILKYPYYQTIGRATSKAEKANLNLYHFRRLIDEDGCIRLNSSTGKYPNTAELLGEILDIMLVYQQLDVVIALTYWIKWNDKLDWYNAEKFTFTGSEYKDFLNEIQIGFWVHDNIIDILGKGRTAQMLNKYKKRYKAKDVIE